MNFEDYQQRAYGFAMDSSKNSLYLYTGLSGEVGEVCSLIAKATRDNNPTLLKDNLAKELGDVLWFVAVLCQYNNLSLADVAEQNIAKLQSRKDRNVIAGSGDNR